MNRRRPVEQLLRDAALWAVVIGAFTLAYRWKHSGTPPLSAGASGDHLFVRINAAEIKKQPSIFPAIHYDTETGFVYARPFRTAPKLSNAGVTARLASRLGPPETVRKGYVYYLRHATTGRTFSIALTAGWGVVYSAPPQEIPNPGEPSTELEAILAACEQWIVSARPINVRVEYIEDDDRAVGIGFENGTEINEVLAPSEAIGLHLRLAQGADPMQAPSNSVYEAQTRMMRVMAPIWAWHELGVEVRLVNRQAGDRVVAYWKAQADSLLNDWDALSPADRDTPRERVRFGVPASALREEGTDMSLGKEELLSRLKAIEASLPDGGR